MANQKSGDGETDRGGRSIKSVQQDFAYNSAHGNEIIWDLLSRNQGGILKTKIKQLVPDNPERIEAINKLRDDIFNSVWAQRKYTNGNSLTSIIYVCVTAETDHRKALMSTRFSCHPVFRTRKCIVNNNESRNCCMVFIDEVGRVYRNWEAYKNENQLPEGTMVAPRQGYYSLDNTDRVKLEIDSTPVSSFASRALAVADTTTVFGGLFSVGVPIAALLTLPVSAPLMATAAGIGLFTAGYSSFRSGSQLYDRSQHEQSINISDRQARNSWLAVAGGIVGLGAAGATRVLTAAATTGQEVSTLTRCVVNGMNASTIAISGTGLYFGALDLILRYRDEDEIRLIDAVQLSASLVLFTHSVYNFRLASSIISETQNQTIRQYRANLSNRQRKMFDKLSKETMRIRGNTRGKTDIIRNVNDIPSTQQFNDLYRINKQLNARQIRVAFGGAGVEGVVLNNEVVVNTQDLRSSVQHNVGPNILEQVTQPIPETGSSAINGAVGSKNLFLRTGQQGNVNVEHYEGFGQSHNIIAEGSCLLIKVTVGFGERVLRNVVNGEDFNRVIEQLISRFEFAVVQFIQSLTCTFVEVMLDDVQNALKIFISSESILFRIMDHILRTYQNHAITFLVDKTLNILYAVKEYLESMNPNSSPELLTKCTECNGNFALCNL